MDRSVVSLRAVAVAAATLVLAAASFGIAPAAEPTLAVFPFAVTGSMDAHAGPDLAAKIARDLESLGGVHVVSFDTPGNERSRALAAGATMYLTGSLAPVGSSVAMLDQLVSTRSSVVMWSSSAQLVHYTDTGGSAAALRTAFLEQAVPHYALAAAPAAPAPARRATREPAVTAAPAPAGMLLPAADPDEIPEAAPAPRTDTVVLPLAGRAGSGLRAQGTVAIVAAFAQRGQSASVLEGESRDVRLFGRAMCAKSGARRLVSGTMAASLGEDGGANPQTSAAMTVDVFDCARGELTSRPIVAHATTFLTADALAQTARSIASAYFDPHAAR